jgi:NAD(P)-dependent dehydrogenase (short-subunit alcohol dehydrogenase family)
MSNTELFSLEGKTALVTGALGLIGKEHCRALLDAGASVIVSDMDNELSILFAEQLGEKAIGIGMDITEPDSILSARNYVIERQGTIDILVNNAAINDMVENPSRMASKFENYPLELFRKVMEVNVTGMFLTSQIFGKDMAEKGKGSIINIASTYGIVAPDQSLYTKPDGTQPFYKSPAYPTAKGAVISFTRFLAAYWGNKGVRVNALSPGGVENGQEEYFINNYSKRTPLGRMAKPTDYSGALVYLASDASSYMTGANLIVDGGWTCW